MFPTFFLCYYFTRLRLRLRSLLLSVYAYSLYIARLVALDLRSRSIAHNASMCMRVEFLWSRIPHSFIPFACDFTTDVFIRIHIAPPRAFLIVSGMQYDRCDAYTRGYFNAQRFLNSFGFFFQLNFFN